MLLLTLWREVVMMLYEQLYHAILCCAVGLGLCDALAVTAACPSADIVYMQLSAVCLLRCVMYVLFVRGVCKNGQLYVL